MTYLWNHCGQRCLNVRYMCEKCGDYHRSGNYAKSVWTVEFTAPMGLIYSPRFRFPWMVYITRSKNERYVFRAWMPWGHGTRSSRTSNEKMGKEKCHEYRAAALGKLESKVGAREEGPKAQWRSPTSTNGVHGALHGASNATQVTRPHSPIPRVLDRATLD
jgi:hypothetical protein